MSDFLTGLVKIRNGENRNGSSVSGLEVIQKNHTILDDAISSNRKTSLPRVSDRTQYLKPSRISRISQSERPQKTKYIVLDSKAIDEIAELSNSQRRTFLSRLSDSERRKVLRALKVRDDLEDGELQRRDLNRGLEVQDLYVINDLLTKYAYSRKDDELRMLESYKDILNENDPQEEAVIEVINKVIDNSLDLEADAETLGIVYDLLEDNEFETESLETALTIGFGDTLSEGEDDVLGDESSEDDLDLGDEGGEDDLDLGDENTEDNVDNEDSESNGDDLELNLGDSVRCRRIENRRVTDYRKPVERLSHTITKKVKDEAKELFDDIEALIIDDAYMLAEDMLNGKAMNISDSMNRIIERYTKRCGEPVRVKDCVDRAFTHSVQEISNMKFSDAQKVKDDIIDQIDERLGGESEEDDTNKTILESLGSALEAYANGDTSELEALSELSVDDINPEEESIEADTELGDEGNDMELDTEGTDNEDIFNEEDEESEEENDEDEDEDEENPDKIKLNFHDSAIKLASMLLNKDKRANKLIDSLKNEVPALKKYNFKISDSELIEEEIEPAEVYEPLLNREEFHSVYQAPAYVGELAKESTPIECLSVASVNYGDLSPVIQVECENGTIQNWIPIMGSSENIAEQLNVEGAQVEKIISDNCVPADDYYSAAAKTNNLGIIDSKFYKRKLSDESWICDEVPEFIKDCGAEAGATFAQEGLTTMPMEIPSGNVLIYGTKYNFYNKNKKKNIN